jgi:hypothetical protein
VDVEEPVRSSSRDDYHATVSSNVTMKMTLRTHRLSSRTNRVALPLHVFKMFFIFSKCLFDGFKMYSSGSSSSCFQNVFICSKCLFDGFKMF